MDTTQSSTRGFWLVLDMGMDSIIIPLAIVVGLAGGAMIGAELARFQAPASQGIH